MPTTSKPEGSGRSVDDRGRDPDPGRFEAFVDDRDAVLTHFEAEWSRACRQVDADLDGLATTYGVATARVDVEANPLLAAEFDVHDLPTVVLFVDGEPVARREGVRDRAALTDVLERHVG